MVDILPTKSTNFDTRDGNHYTVMTVHHTTGADTDIQVDPSVVSAAVLTDDITSSVVVQETASAAGITITADDSATDGLREVTIHSDVATGRYIVVLRHIGSGAGFSSGKLDT